MDDLGLGEAHAAAAGLHREPARGEHVADPLAVAAVGEGDDVAVAAPEQVHGRVADRPRPAAHVLDDAEARQPRGDRPEDAVGHPEVEAREAPGGRHQPAGGAWARVSGSPTSGSTYIRARGATVRTRRSLALMASTSAGTVSPGSNSSLAATRSSSGPRC